MAAIELDLGNLSMGDDVSPHDHDDGKGKAGKVVGESPPGKDAKDAKGKLVIKKLERRKKGGACAWWCAGGDAVGASGDGVEGKS